jgi:hypothetical protein
LRRGEVEIREEQKIFSHQRELGRDRLFDLHDHVRFAPDLLARRDDRRARFDVGLVGDRRADACVLLDHHFVAPRREDRDAGRGHADAKLLSLDLFGNADAHMRKAVSPATRAKTTARADNVVAARC